MKLVEAQGYSKEKALESTDLDVTLDRLKNATQAWKKAGSPISGSKLTAFVNDYIKKYKVSGIYIVVENSKNDTRSRPYSVINEVTRGKRKSKTTYQIKEAELKIKEVKNEVENEEVEGGVEIVVTKTVDVLSSGAVEARADKKEDAIKIMKDLIDINKKDYVIEIVKEITEGQKFAAYGSYTPSKSAKKGKFMFFSAD